MSQQIFFNLNQVDQWILVLLGVPYGVNPLQPDIGMHILHTVLYTFPKVLTRRICLTIKSFYS